MKHALITGIAGQDGAYLAKHLLEQGYKVYGITKPRTPRINLEKIGIIHHKNLYVMEADLTDPGSVDGIVMLSQPDEIFNLAAQSHVGYSFKAPQLTCAVNYSGYLNVLISARKWVKNARIYQAGTSEMFGYSALDGGRQNEETPFKPMSPYAVSKVAAHWAGINARHEADQFVSNGILFNHESPLREIGFVTKKITEAVKRIKNGENHILSLGNIDSRRDWGFAGDYVRGMQAILQNTAPDDFVLATGIVRSVREFIVYAFSAMGLDITFDGNGIHEKGYVDGKLVMQIDKEFYRPNDLSYLCGDASKVKAILGWEPKTSFSQLIDMMVNE